MNGKTRYRVLLVDDDARLRELLSRYLQEQGFAVKAVGDAPMMDRALHREHFDLMVLDLMLPGEDGLAICRRSSAPSSRNVMSLATSSVARGARTRSMAAKSAFGWIGLAT